MLKLKVKGFGSAPDRIGHIWVGKHGGSDCKQREYASYFHDVLFPDLKQRLVDAASDPRPDISDRVTYPERALLSLDGEFVLINPISSNDSPLRQEMIEERMDGMKGQQLARNEQRADIS